LLASRICCFNGGLSKFWDLEFLFVFYNFQESEKLLCLLGNELAFFCSKPPSLRIPVSLAPEPFLLMLYVTRETSQPLQAHTFCCFSGLTIRHIFLVSKSDLLQGNPSRYPVLWLFGAGWAGRAFLSTGSCSLLLGLILCCFALVGLQLSGHARCPSPSSRRAGSTP